MRMAITHDLARGLWTYLSDYYGTQVVQSLCDDALHDVGLILDAIGIKNQRAFVRQRALTIVDTIYTPFVPGEVTGAWMPVDQVAVAIHEHHHAIQAQLRGAMGYVGGYIVRPDVRATYEAEALRTNLEIGYWLTGAVPDPKQLAASLEGYGCGVDHQAAAYNYLCATIPAIKAGEVQSETVRVATRWLCDNERRADG